MNCRARLRELGRTCGVSFFVAGCAQLISMTELQFLRGYISCGAPASFVVARHVISGECLTHMTAYLLSICASHQNQNDTDSPRTHMLEQFCNVCSPQHVVVSE